MALSLRDLLQALQPRNIRLGANILLPQAKQVFTPQNQELGKQILSRRGTVPKIVAGLAESGPNLQRFLQPKTKEEQLLAVGLSVAPLQRVGSEITARAADPVQKVIAALKGAKPVRRAQEALYSAERGQRLARAISVGQKVPGEKGFYAQLGQLKGEMPKVEFESLRTKIGQGEVDELFNKIRQNPTLSEFSKINASQGLAKLFGQYGGKVPTEGEISLLSKAFGKEFTEAVLAKRPLFQKMSEAGKQLANIPRSVMASMDLSAPFRQGLVLTTHPKQFFRAFSSMFRAFGSERGYQALQESIAAKPSFDLMQNYGLKLADIDSVLAQREEQFMSNWAEKIPVAGKLIRASNRAYTGFLNKVRADVFDDLIKKADRLGLSPRQNPELIDSVAKFVNVASGRGSLGAFEKAATSLNSVFFSPRLFVSRLNTLNPLFYANLHPFARKEAIKSLFTLAGMATTVLGLAKAGGAEVGGDPRSADFGKIKIGNTRLDILGGFQQPIRATAQLITGKVVSSTTGKEITLGEGYKPMTRADVVQRFLESKLNPIVSVVMDIMKGKNFIGEKVSIPQELKDRLLPLVWQDIYEVYKENPDLLPLGIPAIFGVGLQSYKAQPPQQKKTAPKKQGTPGSLYKELYGGTKPGSFYQKTYGTK